MKMRHFHHKHVMNLLGVCIDGETMIVIPYMENGDLLSYIRRHQFSIETSMKFAIDIAKGK